MRKRSKGEMCPFCGDEFATGIERGDHMRAKHAAEISALFADCDQSAYKEERVNAG